VADTGATKFISSQTADFLDIDYGSKVWLTGVGSNSENSNNSDPDAVCIPEDLFKRTNKVNNKVKNGNKASAVYGFYGTLKTNVWGLTTGIFFAELPVARLISVSECCTLGWSFGFGKDGGEATNEYTGQVVPVALKDGLYRLDCTNFVVPPACAFLGADVPEEELDSFECVEVEEEAGGIEAESKVNEAETKENAEKTGAEEKPKRTARISALERHRRMGHLWFPGQKLKVPCLECLRAKTGAGKKSGPKVKSSQHRQRMPLASYSVDYYGPFPVESLSGKVILFGGICEYSGDAFVRALTARNEAGDVLVEQGKAVNAGTNRQIVRHFRSDNDSALLSESVKKLLEDANLEHSFGVPYCSTQNPVVERFWRTLGDAMRACMVHCDPRLWDFCASDTIHAWQRRPKQKEGHPLHGLAPNAVKKSLRSVAASLCGSSLYPQLRLKTFCILACAYSSQPTELPK
jgi:hypothetical protein